MIQNIPVLFIFPACQGTCYQNKLIYFSSCELDAFSKFKLILLKLTLFQINSLLFFRYLLINYLIILFLVVSERSYKDTSFFS